MSDDGFETFEVTPQEPEEVVESSPQTQETGSYEMASNGFLHVTIVDHNPVIEGTNDSSYIDVRIPLDMIASGLEMIPDEKFGRIDPDMIVQMVKMGATGELIRINEERKFITMRVE